MAQITLKFEIGEIDPIGDGVLHGSIVEVTVDPDGFDVSDIDGSLRNNLEEWDSEARKKAAAASVDYDSYSSDSAYLDEIDRRADRMATVSVRVHGAVRKVYVVEGVYPEEGGLFCDDFEGVNASEAAFQAAWTMAANDGWRPAGTGDASLSSLLDYIADQRIESVTLKGTTKEDALDALAGLLDVARRAGIQDVALDRAAAVIETDNSAKTDDGVRYFDEPAAAPAP